MPEQTLIVFGGLPGTGKTTLARLIAEEFRATYLRIDAIEQALRSSGDLAGDVGPAGYFVAYALAEENLRLRQSVVADCVNPLSVTRDAWRNIAKTTESALVDIELVCSDRQEHRRRVEARDSDIAGLIPPTWDSVVQHRYEPRSDFSFILDTAGRTPGESVSELRQRLESRLRR